VLANFWYRYMPRLLVDTYGTGCHVDSVSGISCNAAQIVYRAGVAHVADVALVAGRGHHDDDELPGIAHHHRIPGHHAAENRRPALGIALRTFRGAISPSLEARFHIPEACPW
jgi:hypothetical protein